jgi:hypothetical protein
VILEVLDARDPLGCRCLDVERFVRQAGPNKKVVLLHKKIGEPPPPPPPCLYCPGSPLARARGCRAAFPWSPRGACPEGLRPRAAPPGPLHPPRALA